MKKFKILDFLATFAIIIIGAIVMAQISLESGVIGAMAIAIYSKACSKNVGGNSAVFLTEAANIASVTVTAGEVAAITTATGTTFHKIGADLDGIQRIEEGAGNANNMAYTHRIILFFAKPSTALNTLRNSLSAASPCGIIAIVQDANGECWLVGYNETDTTNRPLRLVGDAVDSGNAPADEAGQRTTVTIEGQNGYVAIPFDSTLKAAIIGGSAAYITYS